MSFALLSFLCTCPCHLSLQKTGFQCGMSRNSGDFPPPGQAVHRSRMKIMEQVDLAAAVWSAPFLPAAATGPSPPAIEAASYLTTGAQAECCSHGCNQRSGRPSFCQKSQQFLSAWILACRFHRQADRSSCDRFHRERYCYDCRC